MRRLGLLVWLVVCVCGQQQQSASATIFIAPLALGAAAKPIGSSVAAPTLADALSDDEIKRKIIAESFAGYPGPCPCPYNVDRGGRSCGRRSAYSRPGGYEPLCYPGDVTAQMVADYRNRMTASRR